MTEPKRVLITGAAGNIGYSLAPLVAGGAMLGPNQPVILHLLEIPQAQKALDALVMELDDCAFPLLAGVVATVDPKVAFTDIDYALFVGAFPRREGMERKDLIEKNANIFSSQGKILNEVAKKTVKVVVVGNPANTNCLVLMKNAPSIPERNFTALTRLDHNRAKSQVAIKAGVPVKSVKNVVIWGNHSSTQYPDVSQGLIDGKPVEEVLSAHKDYLHGEFISTVQQRGAAVIKARGLSSAMSAANAIVDHMRDWALGCDEYVSMGVISDGSYGVEAGQLIFSFPLTVKDGDYAIVKDLNLSEFSKAKLEATKAELLQEREIAFKIVGLENK